MNTLTLEGANIHFTKIGQGPVLILIPGANGTGDIFLPLAEQLKDSFTVVTYDRRDYGQSALTEPLPERAKNDTDDYRIKRDAQDVVEIVQHFSNEPVYILGTSSGAIVAMHVLKEHPEIVKGIAFHEPPIHAFLSKSSYWRDKNEEIVDIINNEDLDKGMEKFADVISIASNDYEIMTQPLKNNETEQQKRMLFWANYELRQYTQSDISLEDLNKQRKKITLLNGEESKGSFPQIVNNYINEETGTRLRDIPGGHLGYIQEPLAFADVIKQLWL